MNEPCGRFRCLQGDFFAWDSCFGCYVVRYRLVLIVAANFVNFGVQIGKCDE